MFISPLAKSSKRVACRMKYKILKKIKEHKRKVKKEAKKNPKGKSIKSRMIQIPNICPFKEDILKEVEESKKRAEEEKLKRREAAQLDRKEKKATSLQLLVANAEQRGEIHTILNPDAISNDQVKNIVYAIRKDNQIFFSFFEIILERL